MTTQNGGVGSSLGGGGSDYRSATDPASRQSDCPMNKATSDAPPGSRGCFSTIGTGDFSGVTRGGTLYHAGSILRCRSAGNNDLRGLARGDFDGGGTHVGIEAARPTLRAYSAPHFLHSALFPPKNSALPVGGKLPVKASNTKGSSTNKRERAHSRDGGQRELEASLEVEEMNTLCQHGRGGYLHRYKGFEQEKVSCPPVVTFRVLGGLGECRRRANTVPVGKTCQNNKINASRPTEGGDPRASVRSGTACHADSAYGLSEETPGSLTAGLLHETSRKKEAASPVYPWDLFAEGSRVEPVSPPLDEEERSTPAWCSTSKNRPRGAKIQASWGGPSVARKRKPPLNRATPRKVKMQQDGVSVGSTSNNKAAGRFGAATARSSPCDGKMNSSAFLPYSLERPVSTERAQAFFYTSN